MLQNMATLNGFNPSNLKPSEIKSIIYYCKQMGGCAYGPDESSSNSNYDISKLSAKEIIETYNYCRSVGVPYC